MTIPTDVGEDDLARDDSHSTETGMWPQGWRISPRPYGQAEIVWLDLRDDAEQDADDGVRLTWQVIDTFDNVCWPPGQDRSH